MPYKSLEEGLAIVAWRKRERIELLKAIAQVTATVNPEKAQTALSRLIEEMFPEVGKDRQNAVDKALAIMEIEKEKVYSVSKSGPTRGKSAFSSVRGIMKGRAKPRG